MCDKLLGLWGKKPRYRTAYLLDTQPDPYTIAYPSSYASNTCDDSTAQICGYYPDSTSEQYYYLPSTSCNPTYVKGRSCQTDYSSSPRKRCNKTRSRSIVGKTESQDGKKNNEDSLKSKKSDELKPIDDTRVETNGEVSPLNNLKVCDACCKRFSSTTGPSSLSVGQQKMSLRLSELVKHSSSSCPYYEIAKASHLSCRPLSRTGLPERYSRSNIRNQCPLTSRTVCPGNFQTSCPSNFKSQDSCCGVQKPCATYSVTCTAVDDSKSYTSHCPGLSQCPSFKHEFSKPVHNITCFSTNPYNSNNVKSYSFECPGHRKPSQMLSTCLPRDVVCPNVRTLKTVGMGASAYKTCPSFEQYNELCSCAQEHTTVSSASEKLTGSCGCTEIVDNVACRGGSCSTLHNHSEVNSSSESSCPFLNVPQKHEINLQCPAFTTTRSSSKNVCVNLCPSYTQNSSGKHQNENKCNRISVSFKENEKKDIGIQCPAFAISSSSKDGLVKACPLAQQDFGDKPIFGNKSNYMSNEMNEIAVQCPAFTNIPPVSENYALNSRSHFKSTCARMPASGSNEFKESESKATTIQCPIFANMPSSSENAAVSSYTCSRQNFGVNSTRGKSNESCIRFKRNKTEEVDNECYSHICTPYLPESNFTYACPHYTNKPDLNIAMMIDTSDDDSSKNYDTHCHAFTDILSPAKKDHVNLLTCFKQNCGEISTNAESCSGKPIIPRYTGTKCTLGKCEDPPAAKLFCSIVGEESFGQARSSEVQRSDCPRNLCPTVNFPSKYPPVRPGCKYCEIINNALSIMERNMEHDEDDDHCLGANIIRKMEENNACELQECPANQNLVEKNSSQDTCTRENCQRMRLIN